MLQFSSLGGLGATSQEYVDCIAEGGDADVCAALHPQTQTLTPEEEASIEIDEPGVPSQSDIIACDADPATIWNALTNKCMIAAPGATTPTVANPTGKVATSVQAPTPFPWRMAAIVGGLGLLGVLIYVRQSSK